MAVLQLLAQGQLRVMSYVIGIDLGGTNIKAVGVTPDGSVIAQRSLPTGDDDSSAWLKNTRRAVSDLAERAGRPPDAIGLAAPGLPSRNGRSICFMPGRLKGLEGFSWQEHLGPTRPVPVINDAQAALLGEAWVGAARGVSNAILLTLGTGVGGAALVDGRLLRGHLGRAGHFGHVSLNPNGPPDIVNTPGSLEDAVGECRLPARTFGRFKTTRELLTAVKGQDREANLYWTISVRHLAAAIAGFINVLDPEVVIIAGGLAEADADLFNPLRDLLDDFEWRPGGARVHLVKAELGPIAGAVGAAHNALELYQLK
jgi:glucokinase